MIAKVLPRVTKLQIGRTSFTSFHSLEFWDLAGNPSKMKFENSHGKFWRAQHPPYLCLAKGCNGTLSINDIAWEFLPNTQAQRWSQNFPPFGFYVLAILTKWNFKYFFHNCISSFMRTIFGSDGLTVLRPKNSNQSQTIPEPLVEARGYERSKISTFNCCSILNKVYSKGSLLANPNCEAGNIQPWGWAGERDELTCPMPRPYNMMLVINL